MLCVVWGMGIVNEVYSLQRRPTHVLTWLTDSGCASCSFIFGQGNVSIRDIWWVSFVAPHWPLMREPISFWQKNASQNSFTFASKSGSKSQIYVALLFLDNTSQADSCYAQPRFISWIGVCESQQKVRRCLKFFARCLYMLKGKLRGNQQVHLTAEMMITRS